MGKTWEAFFSPDNEEAQLKHHWAGPFLCEKGREAAENPEGRRKTDKMFHKQVLGRRVKGTGYVQYNEDKIKRSKGLKADFLRTIFRICSKASNK